MLIALALATAAPAVPARPAQRALAAVKVRILAATRIGGVRLPVGATRGKPGLIEFQ